MVALGTLDQYGPGFQIKVISTLLTHKEFLVNIYDILSEEYFSNKAHQWIIKEIIKYYEKYHCNISLDILRVEVKKIENEVLQISIKEQLKLAYKSSEEDLQYVKEEFSNFCKNQQLKKALLNSVDLLNIGDYDSIRNLIDNALKAGQDKNMGHEYNKEIEARYREDSRICIPTPWEKINELLQGGLGGGDFGLIYGNPGGGKSWALVALGSWAARLGYNVVHYTLELGEDYVGRRYDANFTKIPVNLIRDNKEKVDEIIPEIKGQILIKEFPSGRTTVNHIETHLQKIKELDFKPDLIIIDYADLLGTKKRTQDRKGEIDDIYLNLKGLAKNINLPIWSVSQVNRAGAKEDIVEGDRSAGSYDKVMIVDFSMSLSRKREDKVRGTGRFHIMKNRYGMDGMTFNTIIDTSIGDFEVGEEYDSNNEEVPFVEKRIDSNNIDKSEKNILNQKFQNFFELSETK